MKESDISYIAGLFDGEGCVTCKQVKRKRKDRGDKIYNQWYIRCEIAMTDRSVIAWLHETLGFGWSAEKKYHTKPKYKKQWRWCCGYRDALLFAKLMWPYAQTKLHKLESIIDHYEPDVREKNNIVNLNDYRKISDVQTSP